IDTGSGGNSVRATAVRSLIGNGAVGHCGKNRRGEESQDECFSTAEYTRAAHLRVRLSAILLSVYSQADTILKILQVSVGSGSALFLVVLMVSSASAAPLLSVGSNANYQLNASTQSTQSCNAT